MKNESRFALKQVEVIKRILISTLQTDNLAGDNEQ